MAAEAEAERDVCASWVDGPAGLGGLAERREARNALWKASFVSVRKTRGAEREM